MTLEKHYTGKALAEALSVNPETIRRAAAAGKLRSVRVGSERRYPASAVRAWLAGAGRARREYSEAGETGVSSESPAFPGEDSAYARSR